MSAGEMMRVIEISTPGGPEVLRSTQRPRPLPRADEILIEVHAAGVNRPDLAQRAGAYPPPPGASDLPGLEVAGRIAALGAAVQGWRVGDAVCALCNGGGYAEYVAVAAGQCLPLPPGLSMAEAAALPETFFTVWSNVFMRGRLAPGEVLLVHGGASGIGTTAIQLAHALGAEVYATAGNAQKCAACERLGARRCFNYRNEDFVAGLLAATADRGADVILDIVGGDYLPRNLAALAVGGRLLQIATQRGREAALDLALMMRKRLTLTGSTLRPQSAVAKAAIASALRTQAWPLLHEGRVRPVLHRVLPFAQAADAHRLLEQGEHVGKIVLALHPHATEPTPP
ncbi:NAD(P)H-quinone oxidoreductase [Metallibacterium sp.]|uniref:NAD(P)H-quinone oxidoreductase n=1 Tax=Metallibacterium sp. TaxID=2940281 RepID=UPI0026100AAB|nr:NAD(P)H-quinone oxidoreductase [Metallibacterium sp.]